MKFLTANWPAPKNVKAFTTVKNGWYGRSQGDTDERLQTLVSAPSKPFWLTQKHTSTVVETLEQNRLEIADASFSFQPNTVCAVLTADCLPILICDTTGTKVAAIHAGWRGLAAGVIENTIEQLATDPNELLVWFGPAIGPTKFEVGRDVLEAFTSSHQEARSAFTPIKEEKWLANLYTLATQRLHQLGIHQIYGGEFCTYTQEDLFYSYRRDQKNTGRLVSLIWFE